MENLTDFENTEDVSDAAIEWVVSRCNEGIIYLTKQPQNTHDSADRPARFDCKFTSSEPAGLYERPELLTKNFNDLTDRIATLNERAHYWSIGKASWLFENYIQFKVGILLKLRRWGQFNCVPYDLNVIDAAATLKGDAVSLEGLDGWCDEPVFIDVVRGYNAPKHIPKRLRSVICAIGLNSVEDHVFEVGILPAQIVECVGPSAFAALVCAGRLETAFNLAPFPSKREDSVVVGQSFASGHGTDKVIERRSQVANSVTEIKRDLRGHLDVAHCLPRALVCRPELTEIFFSQFLPVPADVVAMQACLIEFQPGLKERVCST